MNKLYEYMKLHKISLEQDLENLAAQMEDLDMESKLYKELDFEYNWVNGQIHATDHLLSVADDILGQ